MSLVIRILFGLTQKAHDETYIVKVNLWVFLGFMVVAEGSSLCGNHSNLSLYQFFDIVDFLLFYPWFFPFRVFHINLFIFYFFLITYSRFFSRFYYKSILYANLLYYIFVDLNPRWSSTLQNWKYPWIYLSNPNLPT